MRSPIKLNEILVLLGSLSPTTSLISSLSHRNNNAHSSNNNHHCCSSLNYHQLSQLLQPIKLHYIIALHLLFLIVSAKAKLKLDLLFPKLSIQSNNGWNTLLMKAPSSWLAKQWRQLIIGERWCLEIRVFRSDYSADDVDGYSLQEREKLLVRTNVD